MARPFVTRDLLLGASNADRFTPEDKANGTLVLNFVDPPPVSLSMDFTGANYSQWANDTTASLSGLVGYYQVKG